MGDEISHRVFLIRHGETVDNIAGLYAGVRDSALTSHGVLQAERLAEYLVKAGVVLSHLFSSDLSRAFKTAEAIRLAQLSSTATALTLTQCEDLREQDFGHYEGKSFMARKADTKRPAKDTHVAEHQIDTQVQPMETKEAMTFRSERFLDQHLIPLFETEGVNQCLTIAIVSHGMLLSSLWKEILRRQPRQSIIMASDVLRENGAIDLDHLGGWSNTGYLDLSFHLVAPRPSGHPLVASAADDEPVDAPAAAIMALPGRYIKPSFRITIHAVNGKEHLKGLKRTRGGVGSSKHDEKQRSLHSFFRKKPKLGQQP